MVMPSPMEVSKKVKPLLEPTDTTDNIITSFVSEKISTFREGELY